MSVECLTPPLLLLLLLFGLLLVLSLLREKMRGLRGRPPYKLECALLFLEFLFVFYFLKYIFTQFFCNFLAPTVELTSTR